MALKLFMIGLNSCLLILYFRIALLSIPKFDYFVVFVFCAAAYGIIVIGDVDGLVPDVDFMLAATPSPRSIIARCLILVGLLTAELYRWFNNRAGGK